MKLHLTIFAFILLGLNSAFSQNNNLQFNRALFDEVVQIFPNLPADGLPVVIGNITVPIGKVWKIEYTDGYSSAGGVYSYPDGYTINNHRMSATSSDKPIWLPEGTYTIKKIYLSGYPSQITYSFTYSGIEFNAVP